jgi:hypothetical protein
MGCGPGACETYTEPAGACCWECIATFNPGHPEYDEPGLIEDPMTSKKHLGLKGCRRTDGKTGCGIMLIEKQRQLNDLHRENPEIYPAYKCSVKKFKEDSNCGDEGFDCPRSILDPVVDPEI